ncbi:MAG: formate dehydrogenase accessory protein FdhE [Anaerolineae bacterium]|nr:formate dehydrogenase accessory protein FdhE [Anaerolineae bacterium]
MSDRDRRVLQALADARQRHGELAELLDFYHDLYRVQFEAKASLPGPRLHDDLAMRQRLAEGVPQLTFDQLGIEPEPFGRLTAEVSAVLARYNPAWQAGRREQPAPTEELLALARQLFDTWDTLTAPRLDAECQPGAQTEPDHAPMLAVGLALAPYLQQAAEAILPRLDLPSWAKGYCPVCGGQPNLALLEQSRGARQLVCSRCDAAWDYRRARCPFCGSEGKQIYYPSQDGAYRLYVCSGCRRYLKTVDLREIHRPVYPPVERLVLVGMDLAAQQVVCSE